MIDFGNKKTLSLLCNLMKDFNLGIDDWCISGECAWVLNDFQIPTRTNHIDIYVKEFKLPWKVRDRMQTLPKKGSLELDLYSSFVEDSGVGLHLVPLPKPGLPDNFIDKYGVIKKFEKFEIKVISPVGNLEDLKLTLQLYDFEDIGLERINRWTKYIKTIRKISISMDRKDLVDKTNYLLDFIDNKNS